MKLILQIYPYYFKNTIKAFALIIFCVSVGFTQKIDSTKTKDSVTVNFVEPVSMKSTKDSLMFTKLKKQFSKNKILNEIYHALFRDVYNQNLSGQEVTQIEQNPFKEYEGRVIRKIFVKRRQVFGESIVDTTRIAEGFDRFLNSLHANTKESIIRNNYLMFNPGDIISADRLRDNERLMRRSPILHDARILVLPDAKYPNLVDLLVITQDIWSLLPDVAVNSFKDFYLGVNQVNFRGLGHAWRNNFYVNYNQKPALEYYTQYTIP